MIFGPQVILVGSVVLVGVLQRLYQITGSRLRYLRGSETGLGFKLPAPHFKQGSDMSSPSSSSPF